MKFCILPLIAALALPTAALAETSEGRELANLAFDSLDTAERGFIDQGEFTNFGNDVFTSMDADQNGSISLGEFLDWGYGMQLVAEEAGRSEAYETAMRVVFAFWDRNGDGKITRTEHRQAMAQDFQRADQDNDALLSREEFTTGFSVLVAQRAAINPEAAN